MAKRSAAAGAPADAATPQAGNRIFLIDAYSFIFRAYHAMARQRPMSTRGGLPTAAIYVFVNMLRKLRDDFHPEYLAAVFDAGSSGREEQAAGMTVRKFDSKTQTYQQTEYAGYKANRAEMPHDLAQQVPYIRKAIEAYRIPIIEHEGFEADDVIGTLARLAAERGHDVYVVSSDKDMLQLVNEKVCVLNPPKDNLICDAAKVEEILGVRPDQVIDVMALRGDSIDNIPGAPGIGDKGSVELIKRFGTLDALLAHASEVERKTYRESLLANRDTILLSKELVTINTHVPVQLDVKAMRAGEPDIETLRPLFFELEFNTLVKELLPTAQVTEATYTTAATAEDVHTIVQQVKPAAALAFAVEGAGAAAPATEAETEEEPVEEQVGMNFGALAPPLMPGGPASGAPVLHMAISAAAGSAATLQLGTQAGDAAARALGDAQLPKAVHDYKSAMHALRGTGVVPAGVRDDSMLFSYLLDPTFGSHSLPDVALRRFNVKLGGSLPESADFTGRLAAALRMEVDDAGLTRIYETIDLPLAPVLARMEDAGVKIDCDVLAEMSQRLEREVAAKAAEIHRLTGEEFNINSPKKLGEVLFNKLNLPKPVKYGRGKTISTAADVLEELAVEHEVPRRVLEFRQLSKLKSTYVDALPALCRAATGRLHTTFNQAATATGRLSSVNPNLQNIPIRTELGREIRAAFVAEKGNMLLSADYSQIELRLLAHFSEDPLLVEAFRRGDDIHTLTASQVFGVPPLMIDAEHRRRAKAVNFGIVYGISDFGLAQQLNIDRKEARKIIDAYFQKYEGVRRYLDSTLEQARRDGRVFTLHGRPRPIPDINSKNFNVRGFAERTAVNTPLQGTAADIIKLAMIRIDADLRDLGLRSRMLLQVHDELVFEVPQGEVAQVRDLVRDRMENVEPLRVPLVVDVGVGPNWRDLE